MNTLLINGIAPIDPARAIAATDRGLQYGDGLFETILFKNSVTRCLHEHLTRMELGCQRLGIPYPGRDILISDVERVTLGQDDGVVKIMVTRGVGGRGYRPEVSATPTRVVRLFPLPPPLAAAGQGIAVRWCRTRLGHSPALAGIKHLNRLEQVLAQMEWQPEHFGEGLMLDIAGAVVCGTSTNVFAVIDATLCTPEIVHCGIRGVMRARVLQAAAGFGMSTAECVLQPADLARASEVFLTNAVRGIVPICSLEEQKWSVGPVTRRLTTELEKG